MDNLTNYGFICSERISEENIIANDTTSNFYDDALRITTCAAFRRLQDKTQLFPLSEHDYARTRLTHTMEVASVARYIAHLLCIKLKETKADNISKLAIEEDSLKQIVCNASLLHDIGNPPFGHYGEDVIKEYFKENWKNLKYRSLYSKSFINLNELFDESSQEYKDLTSFDGNAQSLRVVTKLEMLSNNYKGLNLTASTLGGIIKYPCTSLETKNSKFGYFKTEEDVIKFLSQHNSYKEGVRTIATIIMEAADDICMFVSDLEDSIKNGCITHYDITRFHSLRDPKIAKFKDDFKKKYETEMKNGNHTHLTLYVLSKQLQVIKKQLIAECSEILFKYYDEIQNGVPLDPKHKNLNSKQHTPLVKLTTYNKIIEMKNILCGKKVYSNSRIVIPELEGNEIMTYLLDKFCTSILTASEEEIENSKAKVTKEKILRLISKNYLEQYINEKNSILMFSDNDNECTSKIINLRLHLAIDQVCGMTDSYAKSLYNKLKGNI